MRYRVRARLREDRLSAFHEVLTNGAVFDQQPDGAEIVASMQRARITAPGIIEWYETCFCPTPLQHERETVYDRYLTDIETEVVDSFGEIEGEPFWTRLEGVADGAA